MSGDAPSYNFAKIRELLLAAFTPEELRRFCQDRPVFQPVVNEFGPGQGLDDMVDRVLDYCRTRSYWDKLLAEVEEWNPSQYERCAPDLYTPEDLPPPSPPEQGFDLVLTLKSRWSWVAIGLAVVLVVIFVLVRPLLVGPAPTSEPTEVAAVLESATTEPVPTDTHTPSATPTGTPTSTPSPTHTPTPTSTPTGTHTPTPTLTGTPTSTPSPTHTLAPTPTSKPTHLLLEDVFATSEGVTLTLDIVVRNPGDEQVLINRARIHMQDFRDFYFDGCVLGTPPTGAGLPPSAEYQLDIRDLEAGQTKPLYIAQVIPPDQFDHFKIVLRPHAEFTRWRLYKLKLELVYGTPNQSLVSFPIIFTSSRTGGSTRSADLLYGYQLSDAQILERFSHLLQEPYRWSSGEITSKAKACYEQNLSDVTRFFFEDGVILSKDRIILSRQADLEYDEWRKVIEGTTGAATAPSD